MGRRAALEDVGAGGPRRLHQHHQVRSDDPLSCEAVYNGTFWNTVTDIPECQLCSTALCELSMESGVYITSSLFIDLTPANTRPQSARAPTS